MISDTLSHAASEVQRYMSEMPECYEEHGVCFLALSEIVGSVREWLDNPNAGGLPLNSDMLRRIADELDRYGGKR